MVSPGSQPLYTIAEYLVLERASEERREYLDGRVCPMAGESPEHDAICIKLSVLIGSQLRGTSSQVFTRDIKVRSGPTPRPGHPMKSLFAYPDLFVVGDAPQFHGSYRDLILNPALIVEVLSAATEAFDRGEKFRRYHTWLPSLVDYLLVAQDEPLIDHYHLVDVNRWELVYVEGLEADLLLESFNCTLSLAEVYDRIVFPPEVPELVRVPPEHR